jgi:hypothetical protein
LNKRRVSDGVCDRFQSISWASKAAEATVEVKCDNGGNRGGREPNDEFHLDFTSDEILTKCASTAKIKDFRHDYPSGMMSRSSISGMMIYQM